MAKKLTTEEIDNLYNKMVDNGMSEEADLFIKDPSSFDFRLLEENPNFTDKFKNVAEFTGDKYSALRSLYDAQEGKIPSKSRIESFTEKFPNISKQEILDWFNKTNQYKAEYDAEAKAEGERNERIKEMKAYPREHWFKNILVNDYSKQRYIDDPSTSILGGSKFNPLSSEGQKELRDMGLGATAGLADFIPGIGGVLIGPTVRAGRDVAHLDEKYKPEGKILKNFIQDVGVNAGVEYLPTAVLRKINKGTIGLGSELPLVSSVLMARDADKGLKMINNTIDAIDNARKTTKDNKELLNYIRSLGDSEHAKNILSDYYSGMKLGDAIDKWNSYYKNRILNKRIAKMREARARYGEVNPSWTDVEKKAATRPDLNLVQKVLKGGLDVTEAFGPGAVKVYSTPEVKVEKDPIEKEREADIDRIIKNYSILWSKKSKPQGYDTPLIKAAYDKWKEEND